MHRFYFKSEATMRFLIFIALFVSTLDLKAYDVLIRTPEGTIETIDVAEDQTLTGLMDSLRSFFGVEYECMMEMSGNVDVEYFKKGQSKRNYLTPVTASQKNDIAYIVNTLGMASLPKIAKERSSLKRAGDRLDSIHPFHFLGTIFSDEQMKSSAHALKSRGWVWSGFFDGINTSLTEEQKNDNLNPYIHDFAATVGISPELIIPSINSGNWKELVNILIEKLPRNKNSNRYNM